MIDHYRSPYIWLCRCLWVKINKKSKKRHPVFHRLKEIETFCIKICNCVKIDEKKTVTSELMQNSSNHEIEVLRNCLKSHKSYINSLLVDEN